MLPWPATATQLPLACLPPPPQVTKYSLYFLYLGLASFVLAYFQVAAWTLTGALCLLWVLLPMLNCGKHPCRGKHPCLHVPWSPVIVGLHGQCVIVAVTTSPAFRLTSSPRPTGVRQVNHMRHKYLAAVLRQDVGYFDTTATSGAGVVQGRWRA